MSKTICNLLYIKTKNLNQWNAEKTEKADKNGSENMFNGFKIYRPLSDFSAFSASPKKVLFFLFGSGFAGLGYSISLFRRFSISL